MLALVLFTCALLVSLLAPMCTRDAPLDAATVAKVAQRLKTVPARTFILVHPPWRTDVEDALEQALPGRLVGLALPPDAMHGNRPVALVHWAHAPRPGALRRFEVEEELVLDNVVLRLYGGAARAEDAPPPATSSSSFSVLEALRRAEVKVTGSGGSIACNAWDGGRWVCRGMDEWNFVGPTVLGIDGQARRCLWAHPKTGATLSIRFPQVPLGKAVRVGHGLADGAASNPAGAPVDVVVTAGGTEQRFRHENARGWQESRVATSGGSGDIALDITTPHDGARHFCVWVEVEP